MAEDKNFDRKVYEKLKDHERPLPVGLWENIEKTLPPPAPTGGTSPWIWFGSVVGIAVVSAVLYFTLYSDQLQTASNAVAKNASGSITHPSAADSAAARQKTVIETATEGVGTGAIVPDTANRSSIVSSTAVAPGGNSSNSGKGIATGHVPATFGVTTSGGKNMKRTGGNTGGINMPGPGTGHGNTSSASGITTATGNANPSAGKGGQVSAPTVGTTTTGNASSNNKGSGVSSSNSSTGFTTSPSGTPAVLAGTGKSPQNGGGNAPNVGGGGDANPVVVATGSATPGNADGTNLNTSNPSNGPATNVSSTTVNVSTPTTTAGATSSDQPAVVTTNGAGANSDTAVLTFSPVVRSVGGSTISPTVSASTHSPVDSSVGTAFADTSIRFAAATGSSGPMKPVNSTIDSTAAATDSTQALAPEQEKDTTLQDVKEKQKKEKDDQVQRWSAEAYIGAGYGFYNLGPETPAAYADSTQQVDMESRFNTEVTSKKLELSLGLRVNYRLSDKIELHAGLRYQQYTQTSDYAARRLDSMYFAPADSHHLSPLYAYTRFPQTTNERTTFISLPVGITYTHHWSDKVSIYGRGALEIRYVKSSGWSVKDTAGVVKYSGTPSPLNIGCYLAAGVRYTINEHWLFFVEPNASFTFNDLYGKSDLIRQKPVSVGLAVGMRFEF